MFTQEAKECHFKSIREGQEEKCDYQISPTVYGSFLESFGDANPIHMDSEFAKSVGFQDRVMHGAILNGFLSHFVGMRFPGRNSLLLGVEIRFANPSYLNDHLTLTAKVDQIVESRNVIVLHFEFTNNTQKTCAAKGVVHVRVRDE